MQLTLMAIKLETTQGARRGTPKMKCDLVPKTLDLSERAPLQSTFNDDGAFASRIVSLLTPSGTSIATFLQSHHRPEIIQIMLHKNQMPRRYQTSLQFTQRRSGHRNVHHEA